VLTALLIAALLSPTDSVSCLVGQSRPNEGMRKKGEHPREWWKATKPAYQETVARKSLPKSRGASVRQPEMVVSRLYK